MGGSSGLGTGGTSLGTGSLGTTPGATSTMPGTLGTAPGTTGAVPGAGLPNTTTGGVGSTTPGTLGTTTNPLSSPGGTLNKGTGTGIGSGTSVAPPVTPGMPTNTVPGGTAPSLGTPGTSPGRPDRPRAADGIAGRDHALSVVSASRPARRSRSRGPAG